MSWLHSQQSNFVFTVPILLEGTVYYTFQMSAVYLLFKGLITQQMPFLSCRKKQPVIQQFASYLYLQIASRTLFCDIKIVKYRGINGNNGHDKLKITQKINPVEYLYWNIHKMSLLRSLHQREKHNNSVCAFSVF